MPPNKVVPTTRAPTASDEEKVHNADRLDTGEQQVTGTDVAGSIEGASKTRDVESNVEDARNAFDNPEVLHSSTTSVGCRLAGGLRHERAGAAKRKCGVLLIVMERCEVTLVWRVGY